MSKLTVVKSLIGLASIGMATIVHAQTPPAFAKPEQAIQYRQSVFTVQARAFGQIRTMLKGDVPFNPAEVKANANVIHTLSTLPWTAFPVGTDSDKTNSDIWIDAAGFKAAANKYMLAATALNTAAKTGDATQIKTAVGALGATCKQCHDAYKK